MGKGDKKTRRGKISIKSFGVTRARKKKGVIKSKPEAEQPVVEKAAPKETKKPAVKKETKAKKPEKTEDVKKKE
jgi:ribosomal small subunit protein bTHX